MSAQKKIQIICEEACKDSPYCKQVLSGLLKEIKKRRCSFSESYDGGEINAEDTVLITGLSRSWFEGMIQKCNDHGNTPIVLSNCSSRIFRGQYHCICTGMQEILKNLYDSCKKAGRTNIALYGVDHASDSDIDRMQIFLTMAKDSGNIYLNSGNLEACFQTFLPYADRYDTVLCVNGYAAVSLVRKLEKVNPEILDRIVVVSCEEVLRYSKYNSRILFVDLNLDAYGKAAMQLLEMTGNLKQALEITVSIKGNVCVIPKKEEEEETADDGEFYEDPEIICMARIDQLMMEADQQDHEIIDMLISGDTYSEIAESCFMTEGNVKYRVKKYMTICQVKTKKELLKMLQEYLR